MDPKFSTLGRMALVLALALLVASCGDDDDKKKVDVRVPPAGSAAFQQGYKAGCATGVADADHSGQRLGNTDPRYTTDLDYKKGWDQGYFACYDDESS
ncbi:MAG TPA: hypothetical protein VMF53_13045 [Alphaproteobacteria bacterium]|nr:hypothetical protein [Alphaproteobacteria bacterium]